MINFKIAGAVAVLALAPIAMTSSANADPHPAGRGGAAHVGGGAPRGAANVARGGGANFAARGPSANFAARTPSASFAARPAATPSMAPAAVAAAQPNGYRGGGRHWDGRRWIGAGAGFAAGVAAGAAYGSPYYGDDYAYGNGNYDDSYAYYNGPDVAYDSGPTVTYGDGPAAGGDAVAYCQQTYRSYDPASGTYLGFDGLRHPCP